MDTSTILSIIGYIPFIGWFFPMFFTDEHDSFAQFHAKQGVIVSAFLLALILVYLLLTMMLPPFLDVICTLALIGVIGFTLYHAGIAVERIVTKHEKYHLPHVDRIFDVIPL